MTRRNSIALAFGSTRNSARRSRQAMKDGAQEAVLDVAKILAVT